MRKIALPLLQTYFSGGIEIISGREKCAISRKAKGSHERWLPIG